MNIQTRDEHFRVKYSEDYNTRDGVHSAGEAIIEAPTRQVIPGFGSTAGVELALNRLGRAGVCPTTSTTARGCSASTRESDTLANGLPIPNSFTKPDTKPLCHLNPHHDHTYTDCNTDRLACRQPHGDADTSTCRQRHPCAPIRRQPHLDAAFSISHPAHRGCPCGGCLADRSRSDRHADAPTNCDLPVPRSHPSWRSVKPGPAHRGTGPSQGTKPLQAAPQFRRRLAFRTYHSAVGRAGRLVCRGAGYRSPSIKNCAANSISCPGRKLLVKYWKLCSRSSPPSSVSNSCLQNSAISCTMRS